MAQAAHHDAVQVQGSMKWQAVRPAGPARSTWGEMGVRPWVPAPGERAVGGACSRMTQRVVGLGSSLTSGALSRARGSKK